MECLKKNSPNYEGLVGILISGPLWAIQVTLDSLILTIFSLFGPKIWSRKIAPKLLLATRFLTPCIKPLCYVVFLLLFLRQSSQQTFPNKEYLPFLC